jgi:large subunit ribosomal protein L6
MSGNGNGSKEKKEKTLSRIGRKAIPIPSGVQVQLDYRQFTVQGPSGTLTQPLHPEVIVKVEDGQVVVERYSERKFHRSLHGLTRSMISNAITGVTDGYQKTLELMGVGYRAQQAGEGIVLNVGYSHSVEVKPMEGVTITVEGNNRVHVRGADKQKVGELASVIRRVRPPNKYKEKGIRYAGEVLHLKPGKSAARKN